MIDRAVELEPSDNPQYAIRLGDYQEIRTRVGFMEQTTRIRQQQEEALQRLEEVRLRVVELLGLLAAVIAFLVTGTQISQGLKFEDGARMMVVVGGMILLVFSAYSMVFYSGRVRLVQTLVLGLGLLLAGSALFGTDILHMLHWRSGGK